MKKAILIPEKISLLLEADKIQAAMIFIAAFNIF
jgi:hypothetical protein